MNNEHQPRSNKADEAGPRDHLAKRACRMTVPDVLVHCSVLSTYFAAFILRAW